MVMYSIGRSLLPIREIKSHKLTILTVAYDHALKYYSMTYKTEKIRKTLFYILAGTKVTFSFVLSIVVREALKNNYFIIDIRQ